MIKILHIKITQVKCLVGTLPPGKGADEPWIRTCAWDVSVAVNLSCCLHLVQSCLLHAHTCDPHELMSGVYPFSPGFFPTGVSLDASCVCR